MNGVGLAVRQRDRKKNSIACLVLTFWVERRTRVLFLKEEGGPHSCSCTPNKGYGEAVARPRAAHFGKLPVSVVLCFCTPYLLSGYHTHGTVCRARLHGMLATRRKSDVGAGAFCFVRVRRRCRSRALCKGVLRYQRHFEVCST